MEAPAHDDYRGIDVLVIGLGVTGRAVARFLLDAGARVRVRERRPACDFPEAVTTLGARAALTFDAAEAAEAGSLDGIGLVVPSPGVPTEAPLLREAVRRGIPVVSEIELAARHLTMPLLAVTGTNGKSTTTVLLGEMLRAAGERPFVGGNLGTPLVGAVGGEYSVAVAEVSSFQLEWVTSFRPCVGVFLNLTEDHLERHPDLETYGRLKLRLFARQTAGDVAVLNAADPWIRAHADLVPGMRVWFGGPLEGAASADETAIHARVAGMPEVYPLAAVSLRGAHNRENMMAAILAARAFGVPPAAVQAALERFRGLEHRLEPVRERAGVRWINDSKGTNPGAVIRSLESFDRDVILLAGGIEKGGDYGVLVEPVRRVVKRAIVFGRAREMLARTLAGATEIEHAESLAAAVARAAAVATPGDTVLLSPACASFDMFRDYADRGRQFKALVEAL
jgi:UDP-N-acetylmuramoylalanine--D-glutamate ligase